LAKSFKWGKSSEASERKRFFFKLRRTLIRFLGIFRIHIKPIRPSKIEKWEAERTKMEVTKQLTKYQKEFRKYMATFVIGSLSFVAALLWNDAIKSSLDLIQFKSNFIFFKYLTALIVSTIAIFVIILLSEMNRNIK
jgi:hypothetical protein